MPPLPTGSASAAIAFFASALLANGDPPLDALRQQADAGDTSAMRTSAQRYLSGDGTDKDYGQCMRWLVNAAEAGDAAAMLELCNPYLLADGGYKRNPEGAADWGVRFSHAQTATTRPATRPVLTAEQMFQRALLYVDGKRVREDRRQALAWMLNAAEAGHAVAMRRVGNHYGGVGESKISADWYRRAAEAGDREAMTKLAALYDVGEGVPQDAALAKQWRDRAAATAPGR